MYYLKSTGDYRFLKNMERGCQYWNDNFSLAVRQSVPLSVDRYASILARPQSRELIAGPESRSLVHRGYSDAALAQGGDVLRTCRTLRTVMEK